MLDFIKNNQKGFVASLVTFLVLLSMLSLAISMTTIIINRHKIAENVIKSTQAYYTAEAGVEDSLLRLKNNPQMSPLSYSLVIDNTTTDVVIPEIIGGSRVITSQGNYVGRIKKIQAVYSIDAQGVSFHYC